MAYHWMLNVVPCTEWWAFAVHPSHTYYFEKTTLSWWRRSAPRVPILPCRVGAILSLRFCCWRPVAKSCLTPCGPTDPSMPGLPVHHHLTSSFFHASLQDGKKCWEGWVQGRPLYKNKSKAKLWRPTRHPQQGERPLLLRAFRDPESDAGEHPCNWVVLGADVFWRQCSLSPWGEVWKECYHHPEGRDQERYETSHSMKDSALPRKGWARPKPQQDQGWETLLYTVYSQSQRQ